MIGTLGKDYVEAARSRGVSEYRLVTKHAYKPALIPIITVMGLQIALLLGGAVLTETTFEWKGLGFQLVAYLTARDFVAVQGIVVLLAVIVAAHQLHRGRHRRADRPAGEVLMAMTPQPNQRAQAAPRLTACPSSHQLRQSVGLQRGMLVAGLVLTASSCSSRSSRRWIAPYGFAQLRGPDGSSSAPQQPPSPEHSGARRSAATTCSPA